MKQELKLDFIEKGRLNNGEMSGILGGGVSCGTYTVCPNGQQHKSSCIDYKDCWLGFINRTSCGDYKNFVIGEDGGATGGVGDFTRTIEP